MTWSNILKAPFLGSAAFMTERVLPIVQIWFTAMEFRK